MTAWSTGDYASAWLNHGTQPNEATYEFVVLPGTNATHMQTFAQTQTDNPDGLYRIHQQNGDAHIIEHTTGITGYALFFRQHRNPRGQWRYRAKFRANYRHGPTNRE